MGYVLLRAFSFTFIIIIGIMVRSFHIVDDDAGAVVKKILLYVTLPAVVITNFAAITDMGAKMLIIAFLGFISNVIMVAAGVAITRKKSKRDKALYIFCMPAYNIGAFCLPFVQSFLPPIGSVTACMFDMGNSIMCTGGNYAFACEYLSEDNKMMSVLSFLKRLLSSPPLIAYVVMFLLSAVHIILPEQVLILIDPIAKANTFVAMLMLGLLFKLEIKKEYILAIVKILGLRHIYAVAFAGLIYFLIPFDLIIRQTLVLTCFAPLSAVAPAYTGMVGGDEGLASCINSVSIICSLVVITMLLGIMGLW